MTTRRYSLILFLLILGAALHGYAHADIFTDIGKVTFNVLGGGEADRKMKENIILANEKARDILSMLDDLSKKRVAEADEVVKNRLEQVRNIFKEVDGSIGKNIDRIKNAIDTALISLDMLRSDTIRDIDRIFEQIYGVLDETECIMMGQVMSVEMIGNNLLVEVGKNLDLKEKFISFFRGGKERTPQLIKPSSYYEQMKHALKSLLSERTPVENILSVYADLSFLSRRMQCLHRRSEAQEMYVRDFLEFEQKLKLWKSVYY